MIHYPKRIVIYVKDIVLITGMSERSASRLLNRIRRELGRRALALISVEEFCAYTKLEEENVRRFL
ncbi:MAG: hypothetical protein H7258_03195 [Ferruginibacter sp.]|nr:hypothetical protein [Ferruginibacter sp.]